MSLPSVILHHIIWLITGSQPCVAPFGFLITQLVRSYGVVAPTSERPEPSTVFNKTNILLMKLPPPPRTNPVAEGDAEREAAETEAANPKADDTQPYQSAPTLPEHSQPPQ